VVTARTVPAARADAWTVAAGVPDPELPMLTLADLGILRGVRQSGGRTVVTITPTYSGCPAMREIALDVSRRLAHAGYPDVEIHTELDPPWSSDRITAEGRRKLAAAGIAAPHPAPQRAGPTPLTLTSRRPAVRCPRCSSPATVELSAFGATACRALYRCDECREPFEYVKEI
jgi:ring-1,2-phenylacetyl-CoA epoxidase subunit PaaD